MQHETQSPHDTPFDFGKVIFWGVVAVASAVVLLVALSKFFH
jgi:hypothetical protein